MFTVYDSKGLVNSMMKISSILHKAVNRDTRIKVTLLRERYPRDLSVLTLSNYP